MPTCYGRFEALDMGHLCLPNPSLWALLPTRLIQVYGITVLYVWHDSSMIHVTWCNVLHTATHLQHTATHIRVTRFRDDTRDMTQFAMYSLEILHDSFTCRVWSWHTGDVTRSWYMWRDSFLNPWLIPQSMTHSSIHSLEAFCLHDSFRSVA